MSYIAQKKNRVLRIQEEKAEEYAKMGYKVTEENGKIVADAVIATVEEAREEVVKLSKKNGKLETENEELKAKLTEASLYAEDADKKIAELQKENDELKAAIKAQATAGEVTPETSEPAKKTTAKAAKKAE